MAASTALVPLRDDGSALLESAHTRVSRFAALHAGTRDAVVGGRVRRGGIARARLAPGAARSGVVALVMTQGLHLTIIGLVVGLVGAVGANRLIAALLFGVQPTDPATLGAVTVTITLVAAIACWLPAWRASRLDPSVVLRTD